MKKWVMVPLTVLLAAQYLCAQGAASLTAKKQDAPVSLVPVKVHEKFILENPDIQARWKTDNGVFTAQYINPLNNMGYMIVYDSLGNVLRREKELENQEYPALINDYFTKEFPGEGYVVWSSVDSAGNHLYYSDHNSRILKFDKNGHLLNPARVNGRRFDSIAPATIGN
jgi:hypothetical protein